MDLTPNFFDNDTSSVICPCCNAEVGDSTFNLHLMFCVRSTTGGESERESEGPTSHVERMLKMITLLPLRSRISIMESLYRLSHISGLQRSEIVSPKAGASDREVLKLLYRRRRRANREFKSSRKRGSYSQVASGLSRNKRQRLVRHRKSFDPDLNAEIRRSPSSSPPHSPVIKSCREETLVDILPLARQYLDERMVRKIISRIEPSYQHLNTKL
mmetsp:Transcript_4339/g.6505  ORF Transcript_4339/g.6505 Transcript_4339/m.6505 type:complete len:215 (-) Transcript_4339:300-944(-)